MSELVLGIGHVLKQPVGQRCTYLSPICQVWRVELEVDLDAAAQLFLVHEANVSPDVRLQDS